MGGKFSKQNRNRLDKIIKKAESVIGKRQDKFDKNYQRRLTNKRTDVLLDDTHPLKTDACATPAPAPVSVLYVCMHVRFSVCL